MGYLRGTNKSIQKVPRNVTDYKLLSLQRQIYRNRPTVENFRQTLNYIAPGGYQRYIADLTNDFFTSSLYAPLVLGDRFRNHYLRLNFNLPGNFKQFRVVVYYSKNAGTNFQPSADNGGFTLPADPAAFQVLADRTFTPEYSGGALCPQLKIPLKGITTTINRSNSTIEKGELFVTLMTQSTVATNDWSMSSQHFISDR